MENSNFKSGFVSMLGRTNVGKSSIINALVGEKVAAVANKTQTTRTAIRAIVNRPNSQIIFVDTPGIHKPKTKLGNVMVETPFGASLDVDIIVFVIDATSEEIGRGDRIILDKIIESKKKCILVINKIDLVDKVLELDKKNIEPKLDNLSKIEEELVNNNERMSTLNKLNLSFELAKEILAESYEEMRNTVTPKFTQELSKNISEITEKKYSKIMFNDEQGLIVELESGNYVPASKLSIGTIDQLYLSLRLSMIDELSEENLPIILDEAFAYYDTERLTNILKYLDEKYKTHQIILFTCTNREKEILEKIKVPYNLIEL